MTIVTREWAVFIATKPLHLPLVLICMVFMTFASNALGQRTNVVEKISTSNVPVAVLNAYEKQFPSIPSRKWEKHHSSVNGQKKVRYIAINQNTTKLPRRIRFDINGKALFESVNYCGKHIKKLPYPAKRFVDQRFPGFKITSGEEFTVLQDQNETIYRIKVKKGPFQATVYLNQFGSEISKNQLSKEIKHTEDLPF